MAGAVDRQVVAERHGKLAIPDPGGHGRIAREEPCLPERRQTAARDSVWGAGEVSCTNARSSAVDDCDTVEGEAAVRSRIKAPPSCGGTGRQA